MKNNIEQYLRELYRDPDEMIISIEMEITLGSLRSKLELLQKINPSRLLVRRSTDSSLGKATSRSSSVVVEQSNRIKRKDVLAAIANKHSSASEIAATIGANTTQVTKALSRYAKEGLIKRVKPGRYVLNSTISGTKKPATSKAAAKRGKISRVK